MKRRARETGESSSRAKKHKTPTALPRHFPEVLLDKDIEKNWKVTPLGGEIIVPKVRHQRNKPICSLIVVLGGTEMEEARRSADKHEPRRFRLDLHKWVVNFEVFAGVRKIKDFGGNFLMTALKLAKDEGIPVAGRDELIKIKGHKLRSFMSFDEAVFILEEGRPIIAGIEIDEKFGRLQDKEIYSRRLTKESDHLVLLIGYGVKDREAYFIFLNSWGELFCQDGVGRVYYVEVKNFVTLIH